MDDDDTIVKKLIKDRYDEKCICVSVSILWILVAIAMTVCLILSLVVYPKQINSNQNLNYSYDYNWSGTDPTTQPCKISCGSVFYCPIVGNNITKMFALPDNWDYKLTSMDDAHFTLYWTSMDCQRTFLTIFSNGIKMHFQEMDTTSGDCKCGNCLQTIRFMESGFHKFSDENRIIWSPQQGAENDITFLITGGNICIWRSTLDIRYSTLPFINYNDIVNQLWKAGIGLAVVVVILVVAFIGKGIQICCSKPTGVIAHSEEATPFLPSTTTNTTPINS